MGNITDQMLGFMEMYFFASNKASPFGARRCYWKNWCFIFITCKYLFFQCQLQGTDFSAERIFEYVIRTLPDSIDAKVAISCFPSRAI